MIAALFFVVAIVLFDVLALAASIVTVWAAVSDYLRPRSLR